MSLRLCGASSNILVAACAGGPSPLLPGVRRPLACVRRVGVAFSHVCGRVSFPSGVGGALLGLNPWLVSLLSVLWCALVHRAVLCRALPCCAMPVCAEMRCALLCPAVPRRVVPWCVLPWRGWLRRAVPCRLCCVVLCRVVWCLVVVRCMAVRCGAVCCAAPLPDVFRCVVVCGGPYSLPLQHVGGVGAG